MKLTTTQLALLGLGTTASAISIPRGGYATPPRPDIGRANAVKDVFKTSWDAYYKYAFPNDVLRPVNNTYDNQRNGWGATAIDGITTAIVMEEQDVLEIILKRVPQIDFTTTKAANDKVSVFETTIRYLGGLISAYDMLRGPYSHLVKDKSLLEPLLKQATTLADSLSIAFDTPTGIPDGEIYLNPKHNISGSATNNVAEIGTLVLEWTHLSDLTGDQKYAKLSQKAQGYLLAPKGAPEPWPGLVGTNVGLKNGSFIDSSGGWSGEMDSFYEYLIKMYLYDPKSFSSYKDRWVLAADSTMAHLVSHPSTKKDLTFLAQYDGKSVLPTSGHLASFAGGNFILGGVLLNEQKYKDFGLAIAESYFQTYVGSASGIGPEQFSWVDATQPLNSTNNPLPPANQTARYDKTGFWATNTQYILRPETMESLYYSYRLTGDKKWQDYAWAAFSAVKEVTRAGSAYCGITDTDAKDGGKPDNEMQSFWLAEMLKYSYLIFAADGPVHVEAQGAPNKYVFNTEAHPLFLRSGSK